MDKRWIIAGGLGALLVFQNFDLAPTRPDLGIQEVDEAARSRHAQELLGRGFRGSLAEKAKDNSFLSLSIYGEFARRLPKGDKGHAASLANLVIEEAQAYGLDPVFIMAVISQESSFRPRVRGPVGEIGLMQLRPTTAAWMAKRIGLPYHGPESLENPYVNLKLGIAYMASLRENFKRKAYHYVPAYNMGAGNVRRLAAEQKVARQYPMKVMRHYDSLYGSLTRKQGRTVAANP